MTSSVYVLTIFVPHLLTLVPTSLWHVGILSRCFFHTCKVNIYSKFLVTWVFERLSDTCSVKRSDKAHLPLQFSIQSRPGEWEKQPAFSGWKCLFICIQSICSGIVFAGGGG